MKNLLLIGLLTLVVSGYGQGIRDSVFLIDQVEVSSSYDLKKEKAGMKEARIDTFLITSQAHNSLSDLLASNTSLYMKDYGRGALSTVSFRGTAPSHTQVSWNGMSINSPMLGMVDFSLLPVYLADRVSVLYGAASLASRSGGLGGAVSIENKADWTNKFGGKLYLDAGSFHSSNLFAQLNLGSSTFQSKSRFYLNRSENDYPFVNKNILEIDTLTGDLFHPTQKNRNAAYNIKGFSQEFYYRPLSRLIISNRSWIQHADRSIPTVLSNEYSAGSDGIQSNQGEQTVKNVSEISAYLQKTNLRLRSGFDFQEMDYTSTSQVVGLAVVPFVNSASEMFSWYNSMEIEHDFSEDLSASINGSYNRFNVSTFDQVSETGYDTLRTEASFFGGLYYSPGEKIQLSAQVRNDIVSGIFSPLILSAGITYLPLTSKNLVFKGNISRNYHQPSLNDLYWQPGGNPELLPEEGYSAESSVLYSYRSGSFALNTSFTGYFSDINNWIMWLPGFKGYWEAINIEKVRSYGLEYTLALTKQIRKTELRLHGNFAITRTLNLGEPLTENDESYGKQLPFIPKISGNIFASARNRGFYIHYQNTSMGVRYLLSSSGSTDDINSEAGSQPVADHMYSLYPHYLNKLTLGKEFTFLPGALAVEVFIDNLFNETYRNVLQRFMPGRSFNLHLKYEF